MFLPHTLCKSLYDQLSFASVFCFPVQSQNTPLTWTFVGLIKLEEIWDILPSYVHLSEMRSSRRLSFHKGRNHGER